MAANKTTTRTGIGMRRSAGTGVRCRPLWQEERWTHPDYRESCPRSWAATRQSLGQILSGQVGDLEVAELVLGAERPPPDRVGRVQGVVGLEDRLAVREALG
jgi:hypothetical protein